MQWRLISYWKCRIGGQNSPARFQAMLQLWMHTLYAYWSRIWKRYCVSSASKSLTFFLYLDMTTPFSTVQLPRTQSSDLFSLICVKKLTPAKSICILHPALLSLSSSCMSLCITVALIQLICICMSESGRGRDYTSVLSYPQLSSYGEVLCLSV